MFAQAANVPNSVIGANSRPGRVAAFCLLEQEKLEEKPLPIQS